MEQNIGHYRIISELGRGGMGVVYKAHEESLNRFVALKVLGEHLSEDESYVERFIREAQSAASLNHPNIVQVYAIAEHNGQHYFAMEFVSGTSIQGMIKSQGKMDPGVAGRLILQAASGLGAAHELGIVHRDVKPANLMVDQRGLVKITDFGLALLAAGATRLTATGMFMGTPGYLSPEQCLDNTVDHRTDIYSLGVTLFEMLTGKVPFKADSPLALIRQITEVDPPEILELNPDVPEALRSILRKMMAKDRSQRYADCASLVNDLKAWLDETGGAEDAMAAVVAVATASAASAKTVVDTSPGVAGLDTRPTVQELDADPTIKVDSAELKGESVGPPPPPPQAPPAAAPPPATMDETVPEIVATPEPVEDSSSGGGNKILLIAVAAIVLFALAGASGLAAWKLGWFSGADRSAGGTKGADDPQIAALLDAGDETLQPAATDDVDIEPGAEVSQPTSMVEAPVEEGATPPEGSATTSGSQAGVDPADSSVRIEPETGSSGQGGQSSGTTTAAPPTGPSKRTVVADTDPGDTRDHRYQENEPPRKRSPVGRGVALVSVGEPLLATTASDYVTEALSRRGLEVFDGSGVPGVMDLVEGGPEAGGATLVELVRPHARWLVVVRGEYTGDRLLSSIAGPDREFQARLHVMAYDLFTERPVGPGIHTPIGYTHLTVEKKVADVLRPKFRDAATKMEYGGN